MAPLFSFDVEYEGLLLFAKKFNKLAYKKLGRVVTIVDQQKHWNKLE